MPTVPVGAVQPRKREAVGAGAVAADAAAQHARERRLAGVAGLSPTLALRSPVVLAGLPPGSPSSSTAAAALPLLGALASVIVKLDRRRRRVAVAVRHRERRRRSAPAPITGLSAVNEYAPSAFTLIEPAPMSIACE